MSTHDFASPRSPTKPTGRRPARVGALIAAALALHAVVLGGADWVWPSTAPPPLPVPLAAAVEVRAVEPARAVAVAPITTTTTTTAPDAVPPRAPAPRTKVAPAPAPRPPPSRPTPPAVLPAADQLSAVPAATVSSSSHTDDAAIPLYRTQLAPAARLRYEVGRGALRGIGELLWRPQGEQYELTLDFKLSGLTILSQSSRGGFDAAGIAPQRFTDQRARRGTIAANFQREHGKITYSGAAGEVALAPGAQDRLSWMLQLAAIVSAEPQLAAPGARVVMQVTGARGDAGVWVFRCLGTEPVEARGGAIDALVFLREPREAYDTTVQVWLDPGRHHLPVRATQKSGANDEGYELRLLEMTVLN